tara:strand:- start:14046 stop:22229 length:8184 start_codon:yes stop_codon:yes gene_type:complete
MKRLLANASTRKILARIAAGVAAGGPIEGVEELLQTAADNAVLDNMQTVSRAADALGIAEFSEADFPRAETDTAESRTEEYFEAFRVGTYLGWAFGGTVGSVAVYPAVKSVADIQRQAEDLKEVLQAVDGQKKASETDSSLKAYIKNIMEKNGESDISIDGKILDTFFQDQELSEQDIRAMFGESVYDQLIEYRENGTSLPIEISTEEFLNNFAGKTYTNQILNDVSFHPEEPTLREAYDNYSAAKNALDMFTDEFGEELTEEQRKKFEENPSYEYALKLMANSGRPMEEIEVNAAIRASVADTLAERLGFESGVALLKSERVYYRNETDDRTEAGHSPFARLLMDLRSDNVPSDRDIYGVNILEAIAADGIDSEMDAKELRELLELDLDTASDYEGLGSRKLLRKKGKIKGMSGLFEYMRENGFLSPEQSAVIRTGEDEVVMEVLRAAFEGNMAYQSTTAPDAGLEAYRENLEALREYIDGLEGVSFETSTDAQILAAIEEATLEQGDFEIVPNSLGMYSGLESSVITIAMSEWKAGNEATGKAIWQKLNTLIRDGSVKTEEIKWTGLEEFLLMDPDAKFSRAAVVEFIRKRGILVDENVADQNENNDYDEDREPQWSDREDYLESEEWQGRTDDIVDDIQNGDDSYGLTEQLYEIATNKLGVATIAAWYRDVHNPDSLTAQYTNEEAITELEDDSGAMAALISAFSGELNDEINTVAEEAAEAEYRDNPYQTMELIHDNESYVLFGNEDVGITLRHGSHGHIGQSVSGPNDVAYSWNEAEIQFGSLLQEDGIYSDDSGSSDDVNRVRWDDESYTEEGYDDGTYHEIKVTLPDINPKFRYTTHFPDDNIVAFIRATERDGFVAPTPATESDVDTEGWVATIDRSEEADGDIGFFVEVHDADGNLIAKNHAVFGLEGYSKDYVDNELPNKAKEQVFDQAVRREMGKLDRGRMADATESTYSIEEMQSDWHQQGREHGYVTDAESNDMRGASAEAVEAWNLSQKNYTEGVLGFVDELDELTDGALGLSISTNPRDADGKLAVEFSNSISLELKFPRTTENFDSMETPYLISLEAGPTLDNTGKPLGPRLYDVSKLRDAVEFVVKNNGDISDTVMKGDAFYLVVAAAINRGFKEKNKATGAMVNAISARTAAQKNKIRLHKSIPEAPFGNDKWVTLALKRAIYEAVVRGKKYIQIPNSALMTERWTSRYQDLYRNHYDNRMVKGLTELLNGAEPVHTEKGTGQEIVSGYQALAQIESQLKQDGDTATFEYSPDGLNANEDGSNTKRINVERISKKKFKITRENKTNGKWNPVQTQSMGKEPAEEMVFNKADRNAYIIDEVSKYMPEGSMTFAIPDEINAQSIDGYYTLFQESDSGAQGNEGFGTETSEDLIKQREDLELAIEAYKEMGDKEAVKAMEKELQLLYQKASSKTPRGSFRIGGTESAPFYEITMTGKANFSTLAHESGHHYLEMMRRLAEGPNSNEYIQNELEAINKFLGYKKDQGSDVHGTPYTREQHEKFARAFEKYLAEGKAPSVELKSVFNRFFHFMSAVYGMLTENSINVKLTNEMRGVFDRMIATDEQIKQARSEIPPVFNNQEESGLSDAQWNKLVQLQKDAITAANDEMSADAISIYRKLLKEELKKNRKAAQTLISMNVYNEPHHAVRYVLRTGKLPDGSKIDLPDWMLNKDGTPRKLRLTDVKNLHNDIEHNTKGIKSTTQKDDKNGLDPDEVAAVFGFKSGFDMIEAMRVNPDPKGEIKDRVDKAVAEEIAALEVADDLANKAADKVRNTDRAKALRIEIEAFKKLAGDPPNADQSTIAMYVERARKLISKMPIMSIRPEKFRALDVSAGRKADAAMRRKDYAAAMKFKQEQMLAHYMFREAQAAAKDANAIAKNLNAVQKGGRRKTLIQAGLGYWDVVDGFLSGIGLSRISNKAIRKANNIAEWAKQREQEGDDITIPAKLLDQANLKNWREMTIEELTEINDAIKNVYALARMKVGKKKSRRNKTMEQNGKDLAKTMIQRAQAKVYSSDFGRKFGGISNAIMAQLTKIEGVARIIDGGLIGPAWELLFKPMQDAQFKDLELTKQFTMKARDLLEAHNKVKGNRRRLAAKVNFLGKQLTKRQLLAVLLNMGNEGNAMRLATGYGWSQDAIIPELTKHLNKSDFLLVQELWDVIEGLWPEIVKTSMATAGVRPQKVEPKSIFIAEYDLALRGGYYPVVIDQKYIDGLTVEDQKALNIYQAAQDRNPTEMLDGTPSMGAWVGRGFTKPRADLPRGAPLSLDLGVIATHLTEVTHYISHAEAVMDVWAQINEPNFVSGYKKLFGVEHHKTLRKWVQTLAAKGAMASESSAMFPIMAHFRSAVSIIGMGWKTTTATIQLLGLPVTADEIGYKYAARGIAKALWTMPKRITSDSDSKYSAGYRMSSPEWDAIRDSAPEMRNRKITMDREIMAVVNRNMSDSNFRSFLESEYGYTAGQIAAVGGDVAAFSRDTAFFMITNMQALVDMAAYMGAYEKAQAEGMTDENSVQYAMSVVRITQTSGAAKDLAEIQTGSEFKKIFTAFYSYFSLLATRYRLGYRKTKDHDSAMKGWLMFARTLAYIHFIPLIIEKFAKEGAPEEGEEEEWLTSFALQNITYAASAIPYLGPMVKSGFSIWDENPAVGLSTAAELGKDVKRVVNYAAGNSEEFPTKAASKVVGLATKTPAAAVEGKLEWILAMADDDVEDPIREFIFGVKRD